MRHQHRLPSFGIRIVVDEQGLENQRSGALHKIDPVLPAHLTMGV